LAGDLMLVAAAAVVVSRDARVCRRALRPVKPAILDEKLLGRMVTRRQAVNQGRYRVPGKVDARDARAVVAAARRTAHSLVGIRGIEGAALEVVLEGKTDGRTVGLEASSCGGRLADRATDPVTVI